MESRLDILMWDSSSHRTTTIIRKYPNNTLRTARNSVDFIAQLDRKPKLIIINTDQLFDEDHVYKLLAEGLTDGAYVVTFAQNLAYRQNVVTKLRKLGVAVISFEMNSAYLWISLYNILKPENENNNDRYYSNCEVPENHSGG